MRRKIPMNRICICGHGIGEHYRMSGCRGGTLVAEGADVCSCRAIDQEWWQQALVGTLSHRWVRGIWIRESPWRAREPFPQPELF